MIKGPRPCKKCKKVVKRTWWGYCSSCKNVHYFQLNPAQKIKKSNSNIRWQNRNPDKQKEYYKTYMKKSGKREMRRDYHRAFIYGITTEQYWQMFDEQEGTCFICKLPERRVFKERPTNLVVDHNHETGENRRLLCHACNAALGFLEEDPIRMARMIGYVEEFNKKDLKE